MSRLSNVGHLGVKELWSLARDPFMLVLIIYSFTFQIHIAATAMPEQLNKVPISIVDEDDSPLSARITSAFFPPQFMPPQKVSLAEVDAGLDAGVYTFSLNIPPNFQRDVLAGRSPAVQLNVDATRMSQAFTGSGHIQQIVLGEVNEFVQHFRVSQAQPVELALRVRFNPALTQSWFGSVMKIIDNVTMLAIILAGAALIREREHGTIEHLLVMPVKPAEVMLAKVWSTGLVVFLGTAFSLQYIVQGLLKVPIEGSVPLFLAVAGLHLFVASSLGILMATVARSMPQFGLLTILILLPMQMLSGGVTPRESMPAFVQHAMEIVPTTHFVAAAQAILYRGAGFDVVWPQVLALALIGGIFFVIALRRFRKTITQMT
ncbi:MAG: ABC transporter permease [Desulfovibrionales bacterium]|nr:ABC transporter permease [Desulfovibrionales bacterium]